MSANAQSAGAITGDRWETLQKLNHPVRRCPARRENLREMPLGLPLVFDDVASAWFSPFQINGNCGLCVSERPSSRM